MSRPPLLQDLIHIPERLSDDDLVLKLVAGVSNVQQTLDDYVITPSLTDNFNEALGLIRYAIEGNTSRAAYLHGSFGAGKSHFMAVLHALLRGERAARERPEFAGLVDRHDWLDKSKVLLVPIHMLGAKSLEQHVFSHYIDQVRALRPDAPIPYVHRTEPLVAEARYLRENIGDERFIAGLPGGADDEGDEDEWGDSGFWTSERLDQAFAASFDDDLRRRLVADLLQTWKKGFFQNAKEDAEAFVSLDPGLKELSRHAKELGYDALVLFLDELVLWLINSAGDSEFVSRELQKVTNFVESGDLDRPVPVVSFIARQRDLRETLGEEVSGATEFSILDTLDLAKARFNTITLEDRNLPVIVRERILRPKNEAAAAEIDTAFERTTTELPQHDLDVLFGGGSGIADIASFRKTYPFSPAFVDTLVHLSAALQRSRTALKLMQRLLVRGREELRLGQLIPLGDLYDVITEGGDEPFTHRLKVEFESAQKVHEAKLRPHLLDMNELDEDKVAAASRGELDATGAAQVRAFTGDERLMKTLLLSALAPTVPALHDLTASSLAALNHGSVTDPFGDVISRVASKVKEWAGRFAEVRFSPGDDPGVGLQLVDVDVDAILASAKSHDNEGARKLLVKKLLYGELGVKDSGQLQGDHYDLKWRGSERSVEVRYGNVRDNQDLHDTEFFPADPSGWRLVLDYPFDTRNHTPADDRNRVQGILRSGQTGRSVAWVPAQLSRERFQDLRHLVVLDYLLHGQRFDEHAGHLNATDRHRARLTLTQQRDTLVALMTETLRQAYGLTAKSSGAIVSGFDEHLFTLEPGFEPKLAAGASMADAMRAIADQMFTFQFPAHPDFDPDRKGATVRLSDARTVFDYFCRAADNPEDPIEVEKPHRELLGRIANPLRLGTMHTAKFELGSHWRQHFNQKAAKERISGDLPVRRLLDWIDVPTPHGLDPLVANLVVACFAEQTDRTWVRYGAPLVEPPRLDQIKDDLILREQPLPAPEIWEAARLRAAEVFGLNPPAARRTRPARIFARTLSDEARRHRDSADRLVDLLETHADILGLDIETESGRLGTARLAAGLLEALGSQYDAVDIVQQLAAYDLVEREGPTIGRSIKSAGELCTALHNAPWETLRAVASLGEDPEVAKILAPLREAAAADELVVRLEPVMRTVGSAGTDLLRRRAKATGIAVKHPPSSPVVAGPPAGAAGSRPPVTDRVAAAELVGYAQRIADQNPAKTIEIRWRVVDE